MAAVVGEEVTELLMRTLVEDPLQAARPRMASISSQESFSFKGDALRAHSSQPGESIRPASRSELIDRLHHLVHFQTELCLYAPTQALPREALLTLMNLLMTHMPMTSNRNSLFTKSFIHSKLMALALRSLSLDDRFHFQKRLHQRQPAWSRLFQELVMGAGLGAPDHITLYRLLMIDMALEHQNEEKKSLNSSEIIPGSSTSSSEDEKLTFLTEALRWNAPDTASRLLQKQQREDLWKKHQSQWKASHLSFVRRNEIFMARLWRHHDEKIKAIAAEATMATSVAMTAQDHGRKRRIIEQRDHLGEDILARRKLGDLLQSLSNPRGPWPSEKIIPTGWTLDETEGPQGMRIRLRPAPGRDLNPKFYREDAQPPETESDHRPSLSDFFRPLERTTLTRGSLAEILVSQLSQDNSVSVKVMEGCNLVIPQGEIPGEILLTNDQLHFIPHGEYKGSTGSLTFSLDLDSLRDVAARWYQLIDCALEIFCEEGVTRLIAFGEAKRRDAFLKRLASLRPLLEAARGKSESRWLTLQTQQWQDGLISNFDYLMQLNKLAGRTFNDLMQYPIFPFILADYTSTCLDLNAADSFRDLRKPVSVQQTEKEEQYRNNYRLLNEELQKSHEKTCPGIGPYHYVSYDRRFI